MRLMKVRPDGQAPNRFSDMWGYVIDPGEPPTWADALSNMWAAYFYAEPGEEKVLPNRDLIEVELKRLARLYEAGEWERGSMAEHAVPINPETITFRGCTDVVEWNLGQTYVADAFESSSASGWIILTLAECGNNLCGTIVECRWKRALKCVILNTDKLEYIHLPGTKMKVVGKHQNVKMPEPLTEFGEPPVVQRYYVVEMQ